MKTRSPKSGLKQA